LNHAAGVVFLHVGAALKRHLVDRDGVLARMLRSSRASDRLKSRPVIALVHPPLAAMLITASGGAHGQGVLIDKSGSFVSKQMGVNVEGPSAVEGNLDFRRKEIAKSAGSIELASIDLASRIRGGSAAPAWFDTHVSRREVLPPWDGRRAL
jgi:hypothetical protein